MQIHEVDFPQAVPFDAPSHATSRDWPRLPVRANRGKRIGAFVIHVDRFHDRTAQVEKLIAHLPVPAQVIAGVDGKALTKADIDLVYRRHLHKPSYPFELNVSEIACFLSHRKAWAAIVEQGLDAGFVVEDDVELDSEFPAAFEAACACLSPGAFVRFPFRPDREEGEALLAFGDTSVIKPRRVGLGMVAQLVSRDAALRLLQVTARFDRPVDTTVQMDWMTRVSPLAVVPAGVQEVSSRLGGSTIKQRKSVMAKLKREILRPIYRAKIAFRSSHSI